MDAHVVEEKLKRLEALCQAKGMRLTIQKRVILKNMLGRTDHPTADDVYQDVQQQIPGISRATVYRILDNLVQEGLIQRISHPGSAGRYDGNTNQHHHFLCTSCGQVLDVFFPVDEKQLFRAEQWKNLHVEGYSIYFHGLCERCKKHS